MATSTPSMIGGLLAGLVPWFCYLVGLAGYTREYFKDFDRYEQTPMGQIKMYKRYYYSKILLNPDHFH